MEGKQEFFSPSFIFPTLFFFEPDYLSCKTEVRLLFFFFEENVDIAPLPPATAPSPLLLDYLSNIQSLIEMTLLRLLHGK